MNVTHAIIVAAGWGERMAPYHLGRPKTLLPLMNEPILSHLYRALAEAGVRSVVVVVREQDRPLVESLDGGSLAVSVVVQPNRGGSAVAASLGMGHVPADEPVLALEGDVWVSGSDLARLAASLDGGAAAAALVDRLGPEAPHDWIMAELGEPDAITAAWGHPRDFEWRVSGAYGLSPAARQWVAKPSRRGVRVQVGGMPHDEFDLAEVINTLTASGRRVQAVRAEDPVMNFDKPWHLYGGNLAALTRWGESHPEPVVGEGSSIDPTAQIRGPVRLGRNSRIGHGAIIEGPVYIGDNVSIDDYAKVSYAVVGDDVVISHTAEFLGGVIMNNVYLMHNCELYGVLGDSVDIGAGTVSGTLRFDDRETRHRVRGRGEMPPVGSNATYLGDFSRTGVNVVILPGKHIGPYSTVGPGVVVDRDIEPFTQVLLEQSWAVRKWGPDQYGW
jgi:NDP-sugar pyrophosphorylase family protein